MVGDGCMSANVDKIIAQKMSVPDYLSPEWHDFVIGHFVPEELSEGNPTTAGLRRVAELLLGPVVSSGPIKIWAVEGSLAGRATVQYEIRIAWRQGVPDGSYGGTRVFGDVADTYAGNSAALFAAYAVATSSTRAEGRCLRKALKLRCLSAEEITTEEVEKNVAESTPDAIGKEQITFIDQRCKKLDLDVVKFINFEVQTQSIGNTFRSIYDVNKSQAAGFIQDLNKLTNAREKIPEGIKGYVDWKPKK